MPKVIGPLVNKERSPLAMPSSILDELLTKAGKFFLVQKFQNLRVAWRDSVYRVATQFL